MRNLMSDKEKAVMYRGAADRLREENIELKRQLEQEKHKLEFVEHERDGFIEELERAQARALDCDYLESIASSLLHGHKQSVVDWDAFKALEQYLSARENKNDH